jgi:hypothetical protein
LDYIFCAQTIIAQNYDYDSNKENVDFINARLQLKKSVKKIATSTPLNPKIHEDYLRNIEIMFVKSLYAKYMLGDYTNTKFKPMKHKLLNVDDNTQNISNLIIAYVFNLIRQRTIISYEVGINTQL